MTRWMRLGAGSFLYAMSLVQPANVSGAHQQGTRAQDQRTVWDGVYTEEQAERGNAQYAEACAACHAPDLRGNSTSPSLVGQSFVFLWGGSTLGELFRRVQQVMPPDRPGTLLEQTYLNILAFILSANSYPTGPEPLEDDVLDHIVITANPSGSPSDA